MWLAWKLPSKDIKHTRVMTVMLSEFCGCSSRVLFQMDRLLRISRLILFWATAVWGCLREERACVWNMYTNSTQTGRLWQHLLSSGEEKIKRFCYLHEVVQSINKHKKLPLGPNDIGKNVCLNISFLFDRYFIGNYRKPDKFNVCVCTSCNVSVKQLCSSVSALWIIFWF